MEREREREIDLRWLVSEPEARFIIANGILIDLAYQLGQAQERHKQCHHTFLPSVVYLCLVYISHL